VNLDEHPTVRKIRQGGPSASAPAPPPALSATALRKLCLELGADDVGFVSVEAESVAAELEHVRAVLPTARSYIAFCVRMNRDNVRSPARSIANNEFHQAGEQADAVARRITTALQDAGHRAVNPSIGFPMETGRFGTGRIWVIAHKTVAEAAGLGRMGIHRNLIHPRLGNFILLGTVITDAAIDEPSAPLDFNPCLECKLCVAACPVGAITKDGGFDFQACSTHNYREFMGGFIDWVETIADSADRHDYTAHVTRAESASMWQSLAYKPNYKAAYCMAACPAGEDVIGPFLDSRKQHLDEVVRPLQDKEEPVYVLPGSAAEQYVTRRYPHKTVRRVGNGFPDQLNATLEEIGPRPRPTSNSTTTPPPERVSEH
jgi:Fe-S-cluster-containing hydrogenase component 2